MIPFPFDENRFSFFVADHLLVGQLCTNPKCDRSLLSCLKVIQCSTSEIGDALLYKSCSLLIQVITVRTIARLPRITGMCPGWWKQSLRLWSLVWFQVRATSCHLTSSKSALKVSTKVYLDVLKSVLIPWCNQVAGGRPWVWQQDSAPAHKSKETQPWLQKECYDFVPFSPLPPSSPDLNPPDYFVWSYIENITNMTSHNINASLIAAIRCVFAELPLALVEKACS